MTQQKYVAILGMVIAATCGAAEAAVVTSLNTGATAGGSLLADAAVDPRYALVSDPTSASPTPTMYVGFSNETTTAAGLQNFPFNSFFWVANNATSKWIVPYAGGGVSLATVSPPGTFVYRTTFDLTGFDLATAVVSGQWAVDDFGTNILINGISTGQFTNDTSTSYTGTQGWHGFTSFSINSGFAQGINTIDFVSTSIDQNTGNPVGLRVEGTVTANVPEPGTILLLAGSAVMLVGRTRRKSIVPGVIG